MDEVKRHLKEARERIENKEFEEASQLARAALAKDTNNYMGLVLLGVSLQDSEQVPVLYKKAAYLHPDRPLAWQGLASYLERNQRPCEELLEAYISLSTFESDITKHQAACEKILQVCEKVNTFGCCSLLYDHIMSLESQEKKHLFLGILNEVITSVELLRDSKTMEVLCKIFLLNVQNEYNDHFAKKFFKYIIEMEGFGCVLENYHSYIVSHASTGLADVILENFVIDYISNNGFCIFNENKKTLFDKVLVNINKESSYLPLVETLMLVDNCDLYDAYCKVRTSVIINESNQTMHRIILANVCLKLERWLEAESVCALMVSNISASFQRCFIKIKLISLCSQRNTNNCQRGIDLFKQIEGNIDEDEMIAIFHAYILLKDYERAEKHLDSLRDSKKYFPSQYLLLKFCGKTEEGLTILYNNKDSFPLCWLKIAEYHMELKEYDKALLPLLHAAKADKNNASIFVFLGDYYSFSEHNVEKATKCYLKAFTLNPECDRAGKNLSNTYRNSKNWEANYLFLKELSAVQDDNNCWTLLELGLHHFALEQWDAAIVNLRTYVRLRPDDVEAWESLADAYYSRGSFNSALKCYEKSIQLNPSKKYSVVQVGVVQCLLGQYSEALDTFNSISDGLYLPALKGLSDVYLAIANDKLNHNLFANCRDSVQLAVHYITKALLHNHQFVSLWIDLYTAVLTVARLPPKYRWLHIYSKFWTGEGSEEEIKLSDENLFKLIIQCVCRAISLSSSENTVLYYDLASVYLEYYNMYGNVPAALKAFAMMKNCIQLEQNNWQYWNLFGVICMCKDLKKYALAQHAFLKAVNLEFCNATVWNNLGAIYLLFGNITLANKAFRKAQQFDPSFMASWIGQALIAEYIDHSDSMGLYLHSSQLGFHKESCLGYAQSLCRYLFSKDNEGTSRLEYSIKNMHAVPIACDLMTWLVEYEDEDPHCLNILGILQEKMGLFESAIKCYERALPVVQSKYKDILLINYGRVLCRTEKFEAAMKVFKSVKEEQLSSYCGLALCLNKLGKCEQAYSLYGTAFQWFANSDYEKAQLLVLLASMAYKKNDIDDCKTLVYQCVENSSYISTPVVILSIWALSILISDSTLYQAVAGNCNKLTKDSHPYVSLFKAHNCVKTDSIMRVTLLRSLQTYVHINPCNSNMWKWLSKYSSLNSFMYPIIASVCAQKVISFDSSTIHLMESYRITSIAESCLGNVSKALKFAQKAIHLYPNKSDNWVLLIYACISNKHNINSMQWMESVITFVKLHLTLCQPLQMWIDFLERHSHSLL